MKKLALLLLVASIAGCSSGPSSTDQAKTAQEAPPKYETGRIAFQYMYAAARVWSPDAQPISETSEYRKGAPVQDGKEAVWNGIFAAPSRHSMKNFVYSGVGKEGERGASSVGHEDEWSPSNSSTMSFNMEFLKIDTDKAFQVAQKHGGEKLTKANPDQPVTYACDWDPRTHTLIWHVIYGTAANDTKLRISVDATTGEFIREEK